MIFYFSATGNGEYVAKMIAKGINDPILLNINEEIKKDSYTYSLENDESVGFVLPVHFFNVPKKIEQYLSKLKFLNYVSQYFYAVVTYGKISGCADKTLIEVMLAKNYIINSTFKIKMPYTYILFLDTPKKWMLKFILDNADIEISKTIKYIKEKRNIFDNSNEFMAEGLARSISIISNQFLLGTKKFHVTDSCSSCGRCERICPDSCITIIERVPIWTKPTCMKCLACINKCTRSAIQYGDKTKNKTKYVNPKIMG